MVRLREEYDADRAENAARVSNFPTETAKFEVLCDMCGEKFFVDEATFEKVNRLLASGFDNPFVCDDCSEEFGEAAYS